MLDPILLNRLKREYPRADPDALPGMCAQEPFVRAVDAVLSSARAAGQVLRYADGMKIAARTEPRAYAAYLEATGRERRSEWV